MKKMRIQLMDKDLVVLSDRLVVQDTEVSIGPKEVHEGPLRIEVTLAEKGDIEKVKLYLDKLKGNLPLTTKAKKVNKEASIKVSDPKELIESIRSHKNQDELIADLCSQDFHFVSSQYIEELTNLGKLEWEFKTEEHKNFQFLVKNLKFAKNPMSDKYDWRLAVGINLDKKSSSVKVYILGKFTKSLKIGWANKIKLEFKKKKMLVFPPFMEEDERTKWRYIQRKKETDQQLTPTEVKFFDRWAPHIKSRS